MNIEKLMADPYVALILGVCTIVSVIFGVYTWIKGKKRKEISFQCHSYVVIEGGKSIIPELKLSYKEEKIEDLTITKFAIWNSGNEVLKWEDIVSSRTLQVISKSNTVKILDARIICQSDETNLYEITKIREKSVEIKFDYANIHDGIVLQILHTGEGKSFNADCKIKGGKELKNLNSNSGNKNREEKKILSTNSGKKVDRGRKLRTVAIIMMGIDILLVCFMAIIAMLVQFHLMPSEILQWLVMLDSSIFNRILWVILIGAIGMMLWMYYKLLKSNYYIEIPMKLRKGMRSDDFEERML